MWKKVSVDDSKLFDMEFGGLIDLEEMVDHEYMAGNMPKNKKKRKCKRKDAQNDQGLKLEKENNNINPNTTDLGQKSKKLKRASADKKTEKSDIDLQNLDQNLLDQTRKSWESCHLSENILQTLAFLKFSSPTEIQNITLSQSEKDSKNKAITINSETGSGKTLCYTLACLKKSSEGVNVIIVPTRELCLQVKDCISWFVPKNDIVCVHGGLSVEKQLRLIKKDFKFLIATPGRLWEILDGKEEGEILLGKFKNISSIVFDEADRLFEKSRFKDIPSILNLLKSDDSFAAQLIFVSATASRLTDSVEFSDALAIFNLKISDIQFIGCSNEKNLPLQDLEILKLETTPKDRELMLFATLADHHEKQKLVFVNSIDMLKKLYRMLQLSSQRVFSLHSGKNQKERFSVVEKFKKTAASVLIATDVAGRGLDIQGIDLVVHFHTPNNAEMGVHRSGRTGRAGSKGKVVFIVTPKEISNLKKFLKAIDEVSQHFPILESFVMSKYYPSSQSISFAEKIYPLLIDLEKMEYQECTENKEKTFEKKVIMEFGLDADLSDDSDAETFKSSKAKKRSLEKRNIKNQLKIELSKLRR